MANPLAAMMQQAQKMQEKMLKIQEEIAAAEVIGESGGGLVSITLNGRHEALRVRIDDSLVGEDKDMLEDLVAAAFNDAVRKADTLREEKMSAVTAGLPLPPGFKMPM